MVPVVRWFSSLTRRRTRSFTHTGVCRRSEWGCTIVSGNYSRRKKYFEKFWKKKTKKKNVSSVHNFLWPTCGGAIGPPHRNFCSRCSPLSKITFGKSLLEHSSRILFSSGVARLQLPGYILKCFVFLPLSSILSGNDKNAVTPFA